MSLPVAVTDFLRQKRVDACQPIDQVTEASVFDGSYVNSLMKRGDAVPPILDIEHRDFRSVTEVPAHDYQFPMNISTGIAVGQPYEGIEVTIPVLGGIELFRRFITGRYICPGFRFDGKSIVIKQYNFSRDKADDLKGNIRACIDQLIAELTDFESVLETHRAILQGDIAKAIQKRKGEILAKQEKDRNSDPWG
jgi:hypothetical protein